MAHQPDLEVPQHRPENGTDTSSANVLDVKTAADSGELSGISADRPKSYWSLANLQSLIGAMRENVLSLTGNETQAERDFTAQARAKVDGLIAARDYRGLGAYLMHLDREDIQNRFGNGFDVEITRSNTLIGKGRRSLRSRRPRQDVRPIKSRIFKALERSIAEGFRQAEAVVAKYADSKPWSFESSSHESAWTFQKSPEGQVWSAAKFLIDHFQWLKPTLETRPAKATSEMAESE